MVGLLTVAGALLVGAPSAQAAGGVPAEPGRYSLAYQGASAVAMTQRPDGYYSGTALYVFSNADGTQVCIEHVQYDAADTLISEYGCAPLAEQAFTLDKKLRSATVASTLITLSTESSSRTVEVSATMQAVGDLEKVKDQSFMEHSGCTFDRTMRGQHRTVATTVTLDGQVISGEGGLSDITEVTVVRCD
jgi:hypothetical protein